MNKYLGFFVIFLLLLPVPVGAHSYVEESKPAQDAVVEEAMEELELIFNAGIESVSTATIFNEEGEEVAIESIEVESPVLKIYLGAPLPPSSYVVEWRALGEDSHLTEGSFSFDVLSYELADATEELLSEEDLVEQSENNLENPVVEADPVESSLTRLFLPIAITGAIVLVFIVRFLFKRFR